jgi:hypothetical protein
MVSKTKFQKLMANNAQVNWNVIKIVYGSRDPSVRMVHKTYTYLLH